jgi:hypothetical protein
MRCKTGSLAKCSLSTFSTRVRYSTRSRPFELRDVRLGDVAIVGHVEDRRRHARRRGELLVLHDRAQLAPQPLEVLDLDGRPELLAAHLLDGVGLGLHRLEVLAEQLHGLARRGP